MENITFPLDLGRECSFEPDCNTTPTSATFDDMISQGTGITGIHVRSRTTTMSAGQFPELGKLFAEDLKTLGTMPADGGHSRRDKSDSIIKALNLVASKITVIVERFQDETVTSSHGFSKVLRADLEVLFDILQNLKKLNNDFLSEEGDDPKLQISTSTGVV